MSSITSTIHPKENIHVIHRKSNLHRGRTLPEIAEDVSDLVAINSPHETPLLDAWAIRRGSARSTVHEWLEDALLPNTDAINDSTYTNAPTDTSFVVDHADRFRVGDQIQRRRQRRGDARHRDRHRHERRSRSSRGYGGTTAGDARGRPAIVHILGNAALEGDDAARRASPRARARPTTRRSSPRPSR